MHTRLKHTFFLCLFGLSLALSATGPCRAETKPAAALDSLEIKDGRLILHHSGRPLPDGVGTLRPVEHSDMQFAVIGAFAIEQDTLPVRPGLYLVGPDGAVTYFTLPMDGAGPESWESVGAMSLSPDKDVLALGYFPTLQGSWYFFSWPDIRPLDHPSVPGYWEASRAAPPLFWSGKRQVVVDFMEDKGCKRPCGYDPCGLISVGAYDLDAGTIRTIFHGTNRCDYHAQSVQNGSVTATKLCLPHVADWKNFPEHAPTQPVVAPLP